MTITSSAKIVSDQNGYAGIDSSAAIAFSPAQAMPNQRPNEPPFQIENAAAICSAPTISITQPHVCRPLRMYFWSATKNFESPMAAIP